MSFFSRWPLQEILVFCILSVVSNVFAFEALEKIDEKPENLLLSRLQTELPGISYEVTRETLDVWKYVDPYYPLSDKDDGQRLKVLLHKVSQTDCEALKKLFANERSGIDCSNFSTPTDVDLLRFLDPIIQVSEGKTYNSRNVALSPFIKIDEQHAVVDYSNFYSINFEERDSLEGVVLRLYKELTECWGMAWQLATRSTDKIFIHSLDGPTLQEYFFNPDHVEFLMPTSASLKELEEVAKTTKYGDVLIVSVGQDGFTHVATFIDNELLFERKGEFRGFLNRLISLKDITNHYGEGYSYTVVRPKHEFPPINETSMVDTFIDGPMNKDGSENYNYEGITYFAYENRPYFEILKDETGRYILGPKRQALTIDFLKDINNALEKSDQPKTKILELISKNDFISNKLGKPELSLLAEEIVSGLYDLNPEQIILRAIYVAPDNRPIP